MIISGIHMHLRAYTRTGHSHFPGEPGLAGCSLISFSIYSLTVYTVGTGPDLLDTVVQSPWTIPSV